MRRTHRRTSRALAHALPHELPAFVALAFGVVGLVVATQLLPLRDLGAGGPRDGYILLLVRLGLLALAFGALAAPALALSRLSAWAWRVLVRRG